MKRKGKTAATPAPQASPSPNSPRNNSRKGSKSGTTGPASRRNSVRSNAGTTSRRNSAKPGVKANKYLVSYNDDGEPKTMRRQSIRWYLHSGPDTRRNSSGSRWSSEGSHVAAPSTENTDTSISPPRSPVSPKTISAQAQATGTDANGTHQLKQRPKQRARAPKDE